MDGLVKHLVMKTAYCICSIDADADADAQVANKVKHSCTIDRSV